MADSHFPHDVPIVFAIEWRPSTKQNVQDHSDAPYVAPFIVVWRENLGCNIVCCAESLRKLYSLAGLVLKMGRCAKVYDFYSVVVFWIKQQILWLDISVHNVIAVTIGNGREYLLNNFGSILLVELSFCGDLIKEFSTGA